MLVPPTSRIVVNVNIVVHVIFQSLSAHPFIINGFFRIFPINVVHHDITTWCCDVPLNVQYTSKQASADETT